jgi:signal transduction histidine kinase
MDSQHWKVLLIEDNEDDYIAVRDMLAAITDPQIEVVWVTNYEDALASLVSEPACPHQAYLLDYHLGEHTGLELLQVAQTNGHAPPMILLTGSGTRDLDLQALRLGAAGFLAKDEISSTNLERTIRYAIQQKQTEARLHQAQQHLQRQVAEQSVELEQIRQREDQLRYIQTHLVSAISHEFRNPLMAILASAEMLERYESDPAAKARWFERIHNGVRRITQTLDNSLAYAELESGAIALKLVPLHPRILCEGLAASLQTMADQQQQLQFRDHSQLSGPVFLDMHLLQLMLTHLLLNAIRYAPKSGVIQFNLGCEPHQLLFQIQDHGIGIPLEEQSRVFQAYYRASNANSIAGTPGIGMGLAIAQRAVELHGGSIQLTSAVGIGTTVTVTLPLRTGL